MSDKTPVERLIPAGYTIAPGWTVGEPDGTKGPAGEPTLILKHKGGTRLTIGDSSSAFVAITFGAFVEKDN